MLSLAYAVKSVVLVCGIVVALLFVTYIVGGWLLTRFYDTNQHDSRAENVDLVVTTVASHGVEDALRSTLKHTLNSFPEYDLWCVIDEGSDLQAELVGMERINTVVVPESYDCKARAKGRAINYFTENHVEDDRWYGFIDDDNHILDDAFLYEIPYYESRGYAAMNPILTPREGGSLTTYIADHMRLIEDLTTFRLFTGLVGKPYMGFHGELLCARGDVLNELGFDHDTMVEDFVFSMELVKSGWKTWQSDTRVSILSPHTIGAFYKQRRRWFIGIMEYLPQSPLPTKLLVGTRSFLWPLGITGNWILLPIWLVFGGLAVGIGTQLAVNFAGALYASFCFIGIKKLGLRRGLKAVFLIPICSFMEHSAPIYGVLKPNNDFVVIDK